MAERALSLSKLRLGKEQKRRGWSHCTVGSRYRLVPRQDRILRAITALIRPTHKASINILPPELLHSVFELLAFSDHSTLSACMQVCRYWHDIARLYFFAIVPVGYYDIDHFSQLLRSDPELAGHVKNVRFVDEWEQGDCRKRYSQYNMGPAGSQHPFDVHLLVSALPVLGLINLQYLSLVGFDNLHYRTPSLTPVRQSPAHRHNNPSPTVSLQQLTCDECRGLTLILPSLLSLFSVDTLVIRVQPNEPSTSPWDMSTIHRSRIPPASITIQNLVFEGGCMGDTEHGYYQFFERVLVPGCLRTLGTTAVLPSGFGLPLARLLRCDAARNLLTISIDVSDLMESPITNGGFENLRDAVAHCTRLECFRIRCIHHPQAEWWNHCCRPTTFAHVLGNLPRTLRVFAIYVEVWWWRSWKAFCAETAGLEYVDRVLTLPSPGASGGEPRFPHLERVELNVFKGPTKGWQTRKAKPIKEPPSPTPLPRLKAAGLLRVRVVREDADLPTRTKRANFYLPADMD